MCQTPRGTSSRRAKTAPKQIIDYHLAEQLPKKKRKRRYFPLKLSILLSLFSPSLLFSPISCFEIVISEILFIYSSSPSGSKSDNEHDDIEITEVSCSDVVVLIISSNESFSNPRIQKKLEKKKLEKSVDRTVIDKQ